MKPTKGFFIVTCDPVQYNTVTIYRNGSAEVFFPNRLSPREYEKLVNILKEYYNKIKLIDENEAD
jgi:hypothetical protein